MLLLWVYGFFYLFQYTYSFFYLTLEQPSKPEIVNKAPYLETEQLKKVRIRLYSWLFSTWVALDAQTSGMPLLLWSSQCFRSNQRAQEVTVGTVWPLSIWSRQWACGGGMVFLRRNFLMWITQMLDRIIEQQVDFLQANLEKSFPTKWNHGMWRVWSVWWNQFLVFQKFGVLKCKARENSRR